MATRKSQNLYSFTSESEAGFEPANTRVAAKRITSLQLRQGTDGGTPPYLNSVKYVLSMTCVLSHNIRFAFIVSKGFVFSAINTQNDNTHLPKSLNNRKYIYLYILLKIFE